MCWDSDSKYWPGQADSEVMIATAATCQRDKNELVIRFHNILSAAHGHIWWNTEMQGCQGRKKKKI